MKFHAGMFSGAVLVVLGAIGLPACWDSATLSVSELGLSPGADADAGATVDATVDVEPVPASCAPPRALCGAACTDTSADLFNCGACGNDCTAKLPPAPTCNGTVSTGSGPGLCIAGACQFPTQTMDCGPLHRACVGGFCGPCAPGFQDNDADGSCTLDCSAAALSCGINGSCSDASGTPKCQCDVGFTGAMCETNIDDCAGAPCKNGGTCVDGVASYTCTCVGGFTGVNCATPPAGPLVFVSSTVTKGNIGGLAAADAICQGLATARGFPGTFKALLSDGAMSASSRLARPAGSYKLVDGTVVAPTADALYSGTLQSALNKDELGNVVGSELWTGSSATGAASGAHCNGWTDGTAGATGTEGVNNYTDGRWLSIYSQFCDRDARLYCVQQ